MLLTKLLFSPLNKVEEQCLDGISLFIHRLGLQKIFLTDSLINKIEKLLNNISANDYESFDIRYKVLDRFVRSFIC